jgi:hypothetical protein
MWEQGSVQGFIIFSAQEGGVKNVFQYFTFDNVNIFLVNKMSKNETKMTQTQKKKTRNSKMTEKRPKYDL